MNKRFATISAALGAAAGLLGLGYYWLLRRPLPQEAGRLRLKGLDAPVEVLRDRWGVPHIYAHSAADLMFAQGFVHAQDRLWQMEFNRRLVAGRLAEILGAVALPLDRWMRILTLRRVAEQEPALLSPETSQLLAAYTAGVNARIAQGRLPVEFTLLRYQPEPWTAVDSLSWGKMMAWNLSCNWETELLRARLIAQLGAEKAAQLEPDDPQNLIRVIPPGVDYSCIGRSALERASAARPFTGPVGGQGLGSNNWVIGGGRTASGKPLLANDMHLTMSIPSIWYENHLVGGDLDLSGISFPGVPGIVAGHNGHVAWGFTNGFPDVQDLYLEELRHADDGRLQYRFRDEWLDARVYSEPIRVKGGATQVQEVVVTRHGPIINALAPDLTAEQPLALRWTALEPGGIFNSLYQMSRAHTCAEFREALRDWTEPTQNTVYADVHGDIGYSFPGRIPIRAKGDGRVPVPGWSGEYEWTGYIPFEELPHLLNPPQGFIATANNRVVGPDYPYYFGVDHVSVNRVQRITELIESQAQIDPAFIRRMHFDQVSPAARQVAERLGASAPDDPELAAVVARLRSWDGRLDPASPEAAVYEVFVPLAIKRLLADKLGDLTLRYLGKGPTPILSEVTLFGERSREWLRKVLADPASPWFDLGEGQTREAILQDVLRQTVDFLKSELGPEISDWAWGRLHQIKFSHTLGQVKPLDWLFNRGPFPLGGDYDTVWATGSSYFDLSSQAVIGPPFRFIADLADLGQSQGLLAPGQSGQPASPHYADNLSAWFEAGYHPMLYHRADVENGAVSRLELEPI